MSKSLIQLAIEKHGAEQVYSMLTAEQKISLPYEWDIWARPEQQTPQEQFFIWLIMAGRGFGKMLDINQYIKTKEGWKKLKDIIDGDVIYDNYGNECNVLKAYDIVKEQSYELTFDTGEKIKACKDHLWYTISKIEDKRIRRGKATKGSVKTTKEIYKTVKHLKRETNHRIPVIEPLDLNEKDLLLKPYTLGLWLGDGASANGEITIAEKELLKYIKQDGYITKHRNTLQYTIDKKESVRDKNTGQFKSNNSFHSKLKQLLLIKNKHIPNIYLNSSIEQRTELLKGLMDSDGYCENTGWCEFCNTNKRLVYDTYELISSLGIKARIYIGNAKIYGKITGKKYRIFFKTDKLVFKLKRKLLRQTKATKKQMSRHRNRFIVDVKKSNKIYMRCLSVDSPDNLFLVGKSFIPTHNTKSGAEYIRQRVKQGYKHIALVGETVSEVRKVMVQGPKSGLLAVCSIDDYDVHGNYMGRPIYEPSKREITWANGAIATTFSAENPEQTRGPEHDTIWADELAKWNKPEVIWDNLELGLRLSENPQACITTTPRPIKILKALIKDEETIVTGGNTYENKSNLSSQFIKRIKKKYENTRLGQQEIHAQLLKDNPDSLFNRNLIDQYRVKDKPTDLLRVVVAIDPAATSGEDADDTGIIVVGQDERDHYFVLQDRTCHLKPSGWAKEAIKGYDIWKADRIVAEVNNGGEMVEHTLRTISWPEDSIYTKGENVSYESVHATRGKTIRAEPISALYEQGRVHHVGMFTKLEDEMCEWQPGEDSPDRMDALVWALTSLCGDSIPQVRSV